MKQSVCIIFENNEGRVLQLLRDDKPTIKFPNMWYTLGGVVEAGETPEQAIVREMKEELELDLKDFQLFKIYHWPEKDEYVFYKKLDIDINNCPLHEGQRLQYFSKNELSSMTLAFHDNQIVADFFNGK